MLGWIWIWKDRGTNFHQVKVLFGDFYYYLFIIHHPCSNFYQSILVDGEIINSVCSRQNKWREDSDYKDYRDFSLYELSRIIFLKAPYKERTDRAYEWERLVSRGRRLFIHISVNVLWYPNRFDLLFPDIDLTFTHWKRLSRRMNKRKPRNIVKWFKGAGKIQNYKSYQSSVSLGLFTIPFSNLMWYLEEDERGILLEKKFSEM